MSEKKNDQKKISYISIPNEILFDDDIHPKAKILYLIMKSKSMDCFVKIKKRNLMELLKWKRNETLKKYLKQLKNNNYIYYEFETLPKNKCIEINLLESNPFTQVDRDMFERIVDNYPERSILLYYVLESYYNYQWDMHVRHLRKCNML